MTISSSKIVSALLIVSAVVACTPKDDATGACVVQDDDSNASYCMSNEDTGYCSGAGYTFHAGSSCSAVGYAFFCTEEDMKASGSKTVYAIERYLNNEACDPTASGGGGGGSADGGSNSGKYVQFYADPTKYSREAGYVITGIEEENEGTYSAEASKGTCAQHISFKGSIYQGAQSPRVHFRIHGRNYGSLDTAFGAEYTEETGNAVFYISDFKPGCNTLTVTGGSNNVTLQLSQ